MAILQCSKRFLVAGLIAFPFIGFYVVLREYNREYYKFFSSFALRVYEKGRHANLGFNCNKDIQQNLELPYCTVNITSPVFKYFPQETFTAADVIESYPSAVTGRWFPKNCRAKFRLAIMVPLRGRGSHNYTFLMNMHKYFQMHQYDYGIFIIEQTELSRFNRGMLFNAGFLEINARWPNIYDCFALHDVDIYPMNTTISYRCSHGRELVHLGNAVSRFKYKMPYAGYSGGVSVLSKEAYLEMNGFSNAFFGWGGEDDDFNSRFLFIGGKIKRYANKYTMMYMINHGDRETNEKRMTILAKWKERLRYDGVRNMPPYKLKHVTPYAGATVISVELDAKVIQEDIEKKRIEYSQRNQDNT